MVLTVAGAGQNNRMEVVIMRRDLSLYEAVGGTYTEIDGILYPDISISHEKEKADVGKYGHLWISYMKEIHPDRYRHHIRMG